MSLADMACTRCAGQVEELPEVEVHFLNSDRVLIGKIQSESEVGFLLVDDEASYFLPWSAVYIRGPKEVPAATAAKDAIAEKIRRELVCCDIYGRVWNGLDRNDPQQYSVGEKRFEELASEIRRHDQCYWGEAAARLAEGFGIEWS